MAAPRGDGARPDEVKGNSCALWLAKSLRLLSEAVKLFLFENQAPDGIYPKVWDDPDMREAIAATGAVVIPLSQCENGLAPSDQPDARYRKNSWLLVHKDLLPWAVHLWRTCSGTHQHVPLAGNVPGTNIRRTQEAARYTPHFALDVIRTVEDAYHGASAPTVPVPRGPTAKAKAAGQLGTCPLSGATVPAPAVGLDTCPPQAGGLQSPPTHNLTRGGGRGHKGRRSRDRA